MLLIGLYRSQKFFQKVRCMCYVIFKQINQIKFVYLKFRELIEGKQAVFNDRKVLHYS